MQNRGRLRNASRMQLILTLRAFYGNTEVTCLHSQAIGRLKPLMAKGPLEIQAIREEKTLMAEGPLETQVEDTARMKKKPEKNLEKGSQGKKQKLKMAPNEDQENHTTTKRRRKERKDDKGKKTGKEEEERSTESSWMWFWVRLVRVSMVGPRT